MESFWHPQAHLPGSVRGHDEDDDEESRGATPLSPLSLSPPFSYSLQPRLCCCLVLAPSTNKQLSLYRLVLGAFTFFNKTRLSSTVISSASAVWKPKP